MGISRRAGFLEADLYSLGATVKKSRYPIMAAVLFFALAGFAISTFMPSVYTVSALIEPPSFEHPENLRASVNSGAFREAAVPALSRPRAGRITPDGMIPLAMTARSPAGPEAASGRLTEFICGISKAYEEELRRRMNAVRAEIADLQAGESRIVEAAKNIQEHNAEEKPGKDLLLLLDEVKSVSELMRRSVAKLELAEKDMHNLKIAQAPHVSGETHPNTGLIIAIFSLNGLYAGISFGLLKKNRSPGTE